MILSEVFHDIDPIPQNDGPYPVCAIDYPEAFVRAMDYLRALMKINEHSERALELTAVCLRYNPANYTTWWYRRQCLSVLSSNSLQQTSVNDADNDNSKTVDIDLNQKRGDIRGCVYYDPKRVQDDLKLASQLGGSNPKNYQIWYHRRSILEHAFSSVLKLTLKSSVASASLSSTGDEDEECLRITKLVEMEMEYVADVLAEDSKNYHAWSHRQWILSTVNETMIWKTELIFVNTLIKEDIRNNSAWNQRWFASHYGKKVPLSLENAIVEIDYSLEAATIDPYNESPWRYLIALLREQRNGTKVDVNNNNNDEFGKLLVKCEDKICALKSTMDEISACACLIAAYIDVLEMKNDSDSFEKAACLAQELGTVHDTIRRRYWLMRQKKLKAYSMK